MILPSLHIAPQRHQKHLGLFPRPAKCVLKDPIAKRRGAFGQISHLQRPDRLHALVFRPGRAGHLEDVLGHIHKAGIVQHARVVDGTVHWGAETGGGLHHLCARGREPRVRREGAVVAHGHWVDARELEVAARPEVLVALCDELGPVADRVEEVPRVDEVKGGLTEGPGLFDVVDLELTV